MKIKLFVSHRIDTDSVVIKNEIITPVYCGAVYKKDKWNEGIIGDNTGDNISELRMNFNELTVQYWACKNVEADYYGLCHYRRYFALRNEDKGYTNEQNQIYVPFLNKNIIQKYALDNKELIQDLCQKYDLIIPKPADVKKIKAFGKQQNNVLELWKAYEGYFFDKDTVELLLTTIKKVQPDFYKYALDYLNQDKHRGYNCYLISKSLFEGLCEFQFTILFEFARHLENEPKLKKFPRTIGYMSEILYGIYLHCLINKNIKTKELYLLFCENTEDNNALNEKIKTLLFYYGKLFAQNYFSEFLQCYLKNLYHKIYK